MDVYHAVKSAAHASGVPTTKIGPMMGRGRAFFSTAAARGGAPRADTLAKMLEVCGYALCAVPLSQVDDGMLVIDGTRLRDNEPDGSAC